VRSAIRAAAEVAAALSRIHDLHPYGQGNETTGKDEAAWRLGAGRVRKRVVSSPTERPETLAAYYAASGTPPGVFLGSGLAGVAGGRGVEKGSAVTEEHLYNMLGLCCDPVTREPVGRCPNLSSKLAPVAGFDLTLSPSKSVSVAWALADAETQQVIYDCHRQAVDYVLPYAEREVFHSRSGTNGIVTEDIDGVIAAAFTHFDSRAGDPQLHDHVIIWNRARLTSDGRRTVVAQLSHSCRTQLSHGCQVPVLNRRSQLCTVWRVTPYLRATSVTVAPSSTS